MVKKIGMSVEKKPQYTMQPLEIKFDGIYMVKIWFEIHTTLILCKLLFCASCLITLGEL